MLYEDLAQPAVGFDESLGILTGAKPGKGKVQMEITVNGRARDCSAGTTLSGLLECLELDPARVAVEYNGTIVTQYTFATTQLADGDRLEIVQFVGGG